MSFFRKDGTVNTALGVGISGAFVYVCNQPASTGSIPPSPLATIYSDASGTPLANPVITDGLGNFFFYAATGTYTLVYFDPLGRIQEQIFADQQVVSPGGGSVTSVAMTVPTGFSISGSPVTASGTLGLGYSSDWNANTFIAGPTGGGAGAPSRRTLVTADLPAGVGTVSSVAVTHTTSSALLSLGVSGSPITTSGTIGLTVNLVNQNANTFWAGPVSGAAGPITARVMVPADLPAAVTVAPAASFALDASVTGAFYITLNQNMVLTALNNGVKGQRVIFQWTQDGTGGWTFTLPAAFKGYTVIPTNANSVTLQEFMSDGAGTWRATGPGSSTPS